MTAVQRDKGCVYLQLPTKQGGPLYLIFPLWVLKASMAQWQSLDNHQSTGALSLIVSHSYRQVPLIIIIIIIIAFKGAIRDLLQSPHSTANCLQHVRSSGPSAIVCKSRATHRALISCKCHVTCHLVRRGSSAIQFDRVEIAFIWALFYWLNH